MALTDKEQARAEQVVSCLGEAALAERLAIRRARLHAVEERLLHRELYIARTAAIP